MSEELTTPDPKFQRQVIRLARQLPPYEVVIKAMIQTGAEPEAEFPEITEGTVEKLTCDQAGRLLDELS